MLKSFLKNNFWYLVICIFLLSTSSKAVKPVGVIDHFKVGDVVQSILNPEQFTNLHGKGWVLMDGRPLTNSDDLKQYYGNNSIPDARGLFIRAMNSDNGVNGNDPDKGRTVGSIQAEMVGKHKHPIDGNFWTQPASSRQCTVNYSCPGNGNFGDNLNKAAPSENVATENRPRNVALYVYIKIDEQ